MLPLLIATLWACTFSSAPDHAASLPEGTAHVTIVGEGFAVDDAPVVGFAELERDPVDAVDPALKAALAGRPAVYLPLPADTSWYRVRKVLGSAEAAEVPAAWLSSDDRLVREGKPKRIGLKMSCGAGPLSFTEVVPRVTLSLQRSADGIWGVANARFLPVVDGRPTDGLPPGCLQARPCSDLFSGPAAEACEAGRAGEPAPPSVSLGGEVGCLLPLLRRESDLAMWDEALPTVLKRLGLDAEVPVVVSPEARVRYDVVVATLAGFERAGLPAPALGRPLVEGNDGAPLCTADITSAEQLQAAAARYAGSMMRQEAP